MQTLLFTKSNFIFCSKLSFKQSFGLTELHLKDKVTQFNTIHFLTSDQEMKRVYFYNPRRANHFL